MPKAIIYAAKSTQDRKDSIGTQLEECREMAEEDGWTVAGEYRDEGFSAYSGNRGPGLAAAREHAVRLAAESGEIVYLLAQAHDRFARGAGDKPGAAESLIEVWTDLRRENVHLRTVEDDAELRDEASTAAIGRRAHIDSARKSKSVKKGMKRKRELGLHTGGVVYGYDRDPDLGLVPNAEQAAVVKRIFTMVAAGTSQNAVRRTLNAEGVPTARNGGTWQQGTIAIMLRRRTYLGEIPDDDHATRKARNVPTAWRPAKHAAIIDEALWQSANDARERAAAIRGRNGGPRSKGGHLLPGRLLYHADCGQAMTPTTSEARKDGTFTTRYICSGRRAGVCPGLVVAMADVDDAVIDYLAEVVIDKKASLAATQAASKTEADAQRKTLATARKAAKDAATNLERVRADYMAGKIDADDWKGFRADLEPAKVAAESRFAALEADAAKPVEAVARIASALDLLREAKKDGDRAAILSAIDTVFERFIVGPVPEPDPPIPTGDVAAARASVRVKVAEQEARAGRTVADANAEAELEAALSDDVPPREEITTAAGLEILPVPRDAAVPIGKDGRPAFGKIALRRAK